MADDSAFDELSESFTCDTSLVTSKMGDGKHTIYVRAKDSANNMSSASSDTFTITTVSHNTSPTVCANTAPGNPPVIASLVPTSASIIINYLKPVGSSEGDFENYAVEYGSESGNYTYGSGNIGGSESSAYQINFLKASTKYYIRIIAVNGCASSPWSEEVSATTGSFSLFSSVENLTQETEENLLDPLKTVTNKIGKEDEEKADGKKLIVTILDNKNQPVSEAKVTLFSEPKVEITDRQGKVVFNNVDAGSHRLVVEHGGYAGEHSLDVDSDVEKPTEIRVTIERKNPFKEPEVVAGYTILGVIIIALVLKSLLAKKAAEK